MLAGHINKHIIIARLIDFIVIGSTFLLSCSLLSIRFENSPVIHIIIYSCVVLVSVRLARRVFSNMVSSQGGVATIILGNATGFAIGACAMVLLQFFIPELRVAVAAIFIASIMAFFVLGTIAPLLKQDRPFSPTH